MARAAEPGGERGDDVAGDAPARLDAQNKSLAASERNEETRAAWRDDAAQRDPERFVFVDETGTHTSLTRLYGWAPHDQRATGSVPRNPGKNTTLVVALILNCLHAPWLIEGAMNTETFEWYVTPELAPRLQPGQVVVLDNLSAHRAESIRQASAAPSCSSCRPTHPILRRSSRHSRRPRLSCGTRGASRGTRPKKPSAWPLRPLLTTMWPPGLPMPGTPCLIKGLEKML